MNSFADFVPPSVDPLPYAIPEAKFRVECILKTTQSLTQKSSNEVRVPGYS